MKKIKNFFKLNKNKAFTLAEMLCAIGVSVVVVLTVYMMIFSAQQTFMRLSDANKNTNNFKFLVNSFRESVQYASQITANSGSTAFLTVPTYRNGNAVTDIYWVSNIDAISEDPAKAKDIPTTAFTGPSYSLFKKDGTAASANTFLVLSGIKKIYYSLDVVNARGGYQKLNLGIVYDEVLNDNKNATVRQKKKRLCFVSKGR